jgi:NAD(P)-dependent dehydrogenase (short-subunit alcohol dehydrogenase family)
MARPADEVVLVLGGSGTVGSGVVHAFLARGSTVVTCSRNTQSLQKLAGTFGAFGDKLVLLEGNVSDLEGSRKVLDTVLTRFGKIDHVVSSLGSWWQGGVLTKQSLEEFRRVLHDLAGSHFVAASTFLPAIAEHKGASYTFITGTAGEKVFTPESSLTTVGASALFGITLAARAEFKDKAVRVNEVRIGLMVLPADSAEKKWQVSHKDIGHVVAGIATDPAIRGQTVRVCSKDELSALLDKYKSAQCN